MAPVSRTVLPANSTSTTLVNPVQPETAKQRNYADDFLHAAFVLLPTNLNLWWLRRRRLEQREQGRHEAGVACVHVHRLRTPRAVLQKDV